MKAGDSVDRPVGKRESVLFEVELMVTASWRVLLRKAFPIGGMQYQVRTQLRDVPKGFTVRGPHVQQAASVPYPRNESRARVQPGNASDVSPIHSGSKLDTGSTTVKSRGWSGLRVWHFPQHTPIRALFGVKFKVKR